ncbi:response regulator [Desulfotignum phosphitoxidans]|jgi:DNA-binding NarL/FixJ family response regulator|uniref:Response regulator UvrY n=1 Tax=Desulfotignum phosphitoxidans DSM 13687 TaxID=1286635 RepID=S0G164_9BACT|nr:response regulator transcription factor [Desulfotignum phosphitoxidans]EMS80655.1 response regulator UvrY [Desulfotignum phosphitoxidans DSM 13687]
MYRGSNISVLIVDDHRIIRDGLKSNLKKDDKISPIYEAGNGRDAIRFATKYFPDIVIMDINLPDFNGIEVTRQILKINSNIKVIGLTMHNDKIHVMRMMAAGACGFLTKTCSAKELTHAIHDVFSGKTWVCDEVMEIVAEMGANGDDKVDKTTFLPLSRRETQILKLIADGLTNSEIADVLEISVRTVETHRQNLMTKLDIRNIALLTKFALRQGIAFQD